MIFRSFFIIIILLAKSFFITNFLFAKDPMSAIDWLAEKINDPPDFYTNPSLNFDINNWKEILQNYDNQKIISSWDLGIIAKIDNSNFYIKTKRSKKLFKLHFPYTIQPTFSVGDIVYFKIEKNSGKFIYQQVPNFDGGVLILERDTNKILALDGGFSYFSTSLNMVT